MPEQFVQDVFYAGEQGKMISGDFLTIFPRGGEGVNRGQEHSTINWNAVSAILFGVALLGGFGLWVINTSIAPMLDRLDKIEKRMERIERFEARP